MTLLKMFCAPFDRDETALFNNRRSHYQNRLFAIRCRLCKINLFGTLFFCALKTHTPKRTSAGFVSFSGFIFKGTYSLPAFCSIRFPKSSMMTLPNLRGITLWTFAKT